MQNEFTNTFSEISLAADSDFHYGPDSDDEASKAPWRFQTGSPENHDQVLILTVLYVMTVLYSHDQILVVTVLYILTVLYSHDQIPDCPLCKDQ